MAGYNIQSRTLESYIECQQIDLLKVRRWTYDAGGPYRSLSTSACNRIVRTICLSRIEQCPPEYLHQLHKVARFDLRCHNCAVVADVEIVMRKIKECSRFGKCVSKNALRN